MKEALSEAGIACSDLAESVNICVLSSLGYEEFVRGTDFLPQRFCQRIYDFTVYSIL
jgi:hypothetical protein